MFAMHLPFLDSIVIYTVYVKYVYESITIFLPQTRPYVTFLKEDTQFENMTRLYCCLKQESEWS